MGLGVGVLPLFFLRRGGALETEKGSDVEDVQCLGNRCCINTEGECH